MYVGDGVNDLNALQTADIGVALLEEQTEIEKKEIKKETEKIPYPSIMNQPGNRPASMMQLAEEAQRRAERKRSDMMMEYQILVRE